MRDACSHPLENRVFHTLMRYVESCALLTNSVARPGPDVVDALGKIFIGVEYAFPVAIRGLANDRVDIPTPRVLKTLHDD